MNSIVFNDNILFIEVLLLLLLFSFESFEELPYEISSEGIEYFN
jgi:hypothetical protein